MKGFTLILVLCIGLGSSFILGVTVSHQYIIVDDYIYQSLVDPTWFYTRIGTDRGTMGGGSYSATISGGAATVNVLSGWAGVWTSLMHNAAVNDELDPVNILGPYIKTQYQPYVSGVEVDILSGSGTFKIELKDKNNVLISQKSFTLPGGSTTLQYLVTPTVKISKLNWLVDGAGNAVVKEVRLRIQSPIYSIPEAVFLFTYGHLSQCYDSVSGKVRDRAEWPTNDRTAVQTIGAFALATAIAWDLGYVSETDAIAIIQKTKTAILNLPRHAKGLLPHFLKNGSIEPNSEWSSIDTTITLISEILACRAIAEDTSQLESLLKTIDWNDLTGNGTHSISMGYDYNGQILSNTWDTFGSEAFLVAVAYSAATGNNQVTLDLYSTPPTWDGSGFNDELAALFFPTTGIDRWGNDWNYFRQQAFNTQFSYTLPSRYTTPGLFGLSAGEVPEPWTVNPLNVYQAWGVGGHNNQSNDGTAVVGYPIIAPHYAAVIASEHLQNFENLFYYLLETKRIFSPLNSVESFGIDSSDILHWNALKISWNLCLQALGAGRAISQGDYLPYLMLQSENNFLGNGLDKIMPLSIRVISPNGGESFVFGSTINITWKASRIKRNVKITLFKGSSAIGEIAYNISPDLGSYSWTVGATTGKMVRPGTGYKIKIKEIGSIISDMSDASFTITD